MYGIASDFSTCVIGFLWVCSTNSIFFSSVFIQLLPDLSSAYCPCSHVGLLSLEHASGQELFLIGHRPSVPTGGWDALPELVVSKDYLVVFELYRLSRVTLWIDSHTNPSSQKKQTHVILKLRFISDGQVYSTMRWICRNAEITSNFFSYKSGIFYNTAYACFAAKMFTPVRG